MEKSARSLVALLLSTSSALAGVIFVPVGNFYLVPGLAAVAVEELSASDPRLRVRTTALLGELTLDAADVPCGLGAPAQGCAVLSFDHSLGLLLNLSVGVIEGRSRGRIRLPSGQVLGLRAEARGTEMGGSWPRP